VKHGSDYLKRAEHHLARVQRAKDEPTDWYDLTIYGFYCVEAAVMTAAAHVGMPVDRTHPAKTQAATRLAAEHGLPDVSNLLRILNSARKAAAYGDAHLPKLDARQIASQIERFVQAVQEMVST
jgi:hypothetical protein